MKDEDRPSNKILDRANRDWYEMMHDERDPNYSPDPTKFHSARDLACISDLGIKKHDKSRILVCGCGGGNNTWLLTEVFKCRNVWGVDWSQPTVNFFNDFFRNGKKKNGQPVPIRTTGEAVRADVSKMPYDDLSFDYLLAMDITEHLMPMVYLFFLSNCYRILKYSGRIALLPGMTIQPEHVNLLSLPDISEHMKRSGFHITNEPFSHPWIIGEKKEARVFEEEK